MGWEVSPQTPLLGKTLPKPQLFGSLPNPSYTSLAGRSRPRPHRLGRPPPTPTFLGDPPPAPPSPTPHPAAIPAVPFPGVLAFFFFTHRIKLVEDTAPTLNDYWVPILGGGGGGGGGVGGGGGSASPKEILHSNSRQTPRWETAVRHWPMGVGQWALTMGCWPSGVGQWALISGC